MLGVYDTSLVSPGWLVPGITAGKCVNYKKSIFCNSCGIMAEKHIKYKSSRHQCKRSACLVAGISRGVSSAVKWHSQHKRQKEQTTRNTFLVAGVSRGVGSAVKWHGQHNA